MGWTIQYINSTPRKLLPKRETEAEKKEEQENIRKNIYISCKDSFSSMPKPTVEQLNTIENNII